MTSSRVVYTALIGRYEELNEQPMAASSQVPFVCFTDDEHLRSQSWQIELVEPAMLSDPIRSARQLKVLGHPSLAQHDESLWIDNSVVLHAPPEEILDAWLDAADFAAPLHSFRDQLSDEFDAVVRAGFDEPARVFEQFRHYADEHPALMDHRPLWTALLARRKTPEVAQACETWFHHLLRYSRRDQLSVLIALAEVPELRWRSLPLDNNLSDVHVWPVAAKRARTGPHRSPLAAQTPLALRVRELERSEEQLRGDLQQLRVRCDAAEEQAQALRAAIDHRERSPEAAEEPLMRARLEAAALQLRVQAAEAELAAMRASRAWRAGSVLARLAAPLLGTQRSDR